MQFHKYVSRSVEKNQIKCYGEISSHLKTLSISYEDIYNNVGRYILFRVLLGGLIVTGWERGLVKDQ